MSTHGPLGRPPGPIGFPFIGKLPEFRENPTRFLLRMSREFGDVSYFRLGIRPTYLLNRPDLIEEVLVTAQANFTKSLVLQRSKILLGEGLLTSEGEFHLRQRRLAQPAFHRDRLRNYSTQMVECAVDVESQWQAGQVRDISEEMARLTLNVVGRTLFSFDFSRDARDIGAALTTILASFSTLLLPFSRVVQRLPLPRYRKAEQAREFLDRKIYELIQSRRESGEDRGDLLSMLLLALDEDRAGMTDKQIRDEAMTLVLAGHETTATALTWTWYLLSLHPEVEARFHNELDTLLAGRLPTFDDLPKLVYTEQVLAESMRLYPPAWAIGRMAVRPYRLFNYAVPKKAILIMSPYVMHRHPRFYPDPEKFDPERFTTEARTSRPRYSYFPFGGGPRVCIGERFAWMEGLMVLATIGQKWRLRLQPGQAIETNPQITLRTRYGMKMKLEPRMPSISAPS